MGILRRVDELGRVVLPIELRRDLDIGERDLVEVCLEGDAIVLRKATAKCVYCGADSDLFSYRAKSICRSYLTQINNQDHVSRGRTSPPPDGAGDVFSPGAWFSGTGRKTGGLTRPAASVMLQSNIRRDGT